MGIENFLPIQEEIHQWSDRRKKISRVLIPMIVFVHVDALERKKVLELYSVNRVYGESWRKCAVGHTR